MRVLAAIGRALTFLLAALGKGLAFLFRALFSLLSRSRAALIVFIVAVVVLAGGLVDFGMNLGKAYPGVRVGEIDAAGKTADEIAALLDETYGTRLAGGSVVIYANDEAEARVADEAAAAQDAALAEQLAVDEAQANKLAWTTDASLLKASLPARELAAQALAVGREDGGLLARVGALFSGRVLDIHADYDKAALEALASDIDATIGDPRVDYDITVEGGVASVTKGHDGQMVDRAVFADELDRVLLKSAEGHGSFVAHAEYAPLRVDEQEAQRVCDAVNAAIADGARFTYEGASWDASSSEVGSWVATRVEREGEGYRLVPCIDEKLAKPSLLASAKKAHSGERVRVTFEAQGDQIVANTDGSGKLPLTAQAVKSLDEALFRQGSTDRASGPVEVAIETGATPTSVPFDEALDLGIVGEISSFTTEFTTGEGTENRNHNIELVSELLSNSIVKPGGSWSFNQTAGECNEERGFLGAGAIIDGEYSDAVGGGICQVATTVFNAVYESGFPVSSRTNHSLYISSYPEGRDAAVSWPDLDLVWENDADSDVLVRLSCGEGSVTATLYGVDPGYQVSSETGEWSKGERYGKKTEVDDSLAPGTSYVKTMGTDGRSITVVRTVTDDAGTILHEDVFGSTYEPVTEVVVEGPKANGGSKSADAEGTASA